MMAIEEFIEALKIGETLKERLQTVKQEQGASWQGSEDYSDAISYVGELMEVAAIKMVEAAEHQKENAMHQLRLIGIVQTIEDT